MHVWTISHKIKPRNEKKQVYFMPKTPSWSLRSFWSSKYEILKSFWWLVKWSLRRRFELIIRAKHRFCTDGPRPQIKAFVDKFWRVFLISSLYFALTDQKCTFYLSSKLPSGRYEVSSNWSFALTFVLSLRMTLDPKRRPLWKYVDVFYSFMGFILPKFDQKRTFKVICSKFSVPEWQYGALTT